MKGNRQKATVEDVIIDLVIGQANLSCDDYEKAREKVRCLSKTEKMTLAQQSDFPNTWKELFEQDTEWFKAELPPNTEFVNKIFDSGKGFMTHIGLKHSELMKMYKDKTMSKEHRTTIDKIRKKLAEHPRVIVLTKDFKEYSIFDGARRALAFMFENKPLPVFIGQRKSFQALPNLR